MNAMSGIQGHEAIDTKKLTVVGSVVGAFTTEAEAGWVDGA